MVASAHTVLAWVAIVANGLVGLWAVGAHWQERLRHPTLWWAVGTAQVLLFVQVTLGVIHLNQLGIEPDQFHLLYGFSTLIAVAILYGYRQQLPHLRHLLYGGGSLFIMGLALRAAFLDGV